jgi:hypothetical protein
MTTTIDELQIGDTIKFKNDHGIFMTGEIIDKSEVAVRVWTPISTYIVNQNQIERKLPKLILPKNNVFYM